MHKEEVADTSGQIDRGGSRLKNPRRDTHPSPLEVVCFWDVQTRWSFMALRDTPQSSILEPKEKNSFKAQDMVYIL